MVNTIYNSKNKTLIHINVLSILVIITMCCSIGLLLIIQHPNKVEARFNVYKSHIPRTMSSKVNGKIYFLKQNGDKLHQGEEIAVITNNTDYYHICRLENVLKQKTNKEIITYLTQNASQLDELYSIYNELTHSNDALVEAKNELIHKTDINLINNDEKSYIEMIKAQTSKIQLEQEILSLSKLRLEEDSNLYIKNAITRNELENSLRNFYTNKEALQESTQELEQLKIKLIGAKLNIRKTTEKYNTEIRNGIHDLEYFRRKLIDAILEWKEIHILKAPCAGYVEVKSFIECGQIVRAGDEILKVIPNGDNVKAYFYCPSKNAAGIHKGLTVKLYLDNYERNDYGFVVGKIAYISKTLTINNDGSTMYTGIVNIDQRDQTNFHGSLHIDEGMSGTMDIIIEPRSLISEVFNYINELIK